MLIAHYKRFGLPKLRLPIWFTHCVWRHPNLGSFTSLCSGIWGQEELIEIIYKVHPVSWHMKMKLWFLSLRSLLYFTDFFSKTVTIYFDTYKWSKIFSLHSLNIKIMGALAGAPYHCFKKSSHFDYQQNVKWLWLFSLEMAFMCVLPLTWITNYCPSHWGQIGPTACLCEYLL